ncbi:MAG: glycerophosphodiester phosphodiesterase family protein [Pseudomonadota bacterium]
MTTPRTTDPGRLIAHRGASRVAPENTLAAFRAARAQSVHWIEFDVTLLGDDLPVIHHDATLERCTSHSGPILGLDEADLTRIDASKGFGDQFLGEPIPTLSATLMLIDELELYANLEMKLNDGAPDMLARQTASALEAYPWSRERILVSSFNHETLAIFRGLCPEQPIAALWDDPPSDWSDTTDALDACAVHMNYRNLNAKLLESVCGRGLDLRVYTINEPVLMAPFREKGLTGVITDHPPLFQDLNDWRTWSTG